LHLRKIVILSKIDVIEMYQHCFERRIDMASTFPALRGKMGEMEYVLVMMRLGELVKHVGYAEDIQEWDSGIPSEFKKQRKLNMSRIVHEMVPYLTVNPDHFYAAITAELERPGDPQNRLLFASTEGGDGTMGILTLDGSERVMALDGQHRLKSIELAMRTHPDLSRESIAVILVPGKGYRKSQQLFTDLNRYAKQPSKTLNLLFEHREFFAVVAKEVGGNARTFRDRVNLETNSLGQKSRQHITLAVLYECVLALLDGHYVDSENSVTKVREAAEIVRHIYDDVVTPVLPDFEDMLAGKVLPFDLRTKYIFNHSVGQQAIARTIRVVRDQFGDKWEDVVRPAFAAIDWRITSPQWEGAAVQGGAIGSRRQNIEQTATVLKLLTGITVPQTELDSLRNALQASDPSRSLPEPVIKVAA
jgi:DNA sulfur modification protein DndB